MLTLCGSRPARTLVTRPRTMSAMLRKQVLPRKRYKLKDLSHMVDSSPPFFLSTSFLSDIAPPLACRPHLAFSHLALRPITPHFLLLLSLLNHVRPTRDRPGCLEHRQRTVSRPHVRRIPRLTGSVSLFGTRASSVSTTHTKRPVRTGLASLYLR